MSEATHVGSGKVRELYALDDERLLLVASDRISTFDVILPTEIPDKGRVLTGVSGFWFARTSELVPEPPARTARRRSLDRVPAGSRCCRSNASCAATSPAPAGRTTSRPARSAATSSLRGLSSRSSCRARSSRRRRRRRPGTTRTSTAPRRSSSSARSGSTRSRPSRSRSTRFVSDYARERGIILADTKLEFGLDEQGQLVLGDEAFTPDSSRFWPADEYKPGGTPPSYDKQFVRDYCESLGWDKTAPGPELPDAVVDRDARALHRGVRAPDGHRLRRLPRRPERGARGEGNRARPPEAGDPRPAGAGGRELAAPPRVRRERRARRPPGRRRRRDRRPRPRRSRRSSACASSCSRTR